MSHLDVKELFSHLNTVEVAEVLLVVRIRPSQDYSEGSGNELMGDMNSSRRMIPRRP